MSILFFMRETLLAIGQPLGERYIAPEGFERCFVTYDRDTKQVIFAFTDKVKDAPPRR